MSRPERIVLGVYGAWATLLVLAVLAREGLSANNVTRLLVVAYLLAGLGWYALTRRHTVRQGSAAFVLRCTASALAVELFYMPSRPVFAALRWTRATPVATLAKHALIDLAFTAPAYLVIFSVCWLLLRRYRYRVAEYALLFSLGQALGDGNAFFVANPGALWLAPWVMLNYQAINVVPYLRARPHLAGERSSAARLVAPLVAIPATYWVMGACIKLVGRRLGLE